MRGPLVERVARGATAGVVATAAMSAVMLASYATGRVGRPAPEIITDAALSAVGVGSPAVERAAAVAAHVAYGTANGVIFSLVREHLPGGRAGKGVLFGVALLLLSYEGWVPGAGVLPPLDQQRRPRFMTLTLAHLVYGAVLGWATT